MMKAVLGIALCALVVSISGCASMIDPRKVTQEEETAMAAERGEPVGRLADAGTAALTAEIEAATLDDFDIVYMFKIGKHSEEIGVYGEAEERAATALLKWLTENGVSESMILRFVGSNDFGPQYGEGRKGYYFGAVLKEPIPQQFGIPDYGGYFPRDGNMIIERFHGGLFARCSSTTDIKSAWMKKPEEAYIPWLEEKELLDYFGRRQCLEEYIPVSKDPNRLLGLPFEKRWTAYRIYQPVEKELKRFRHDGMPSFSIECPRGSTRATTDSPDQVFAAATVDGVMFQAAVKDIPPGQTLDRAAEGYAANLESVGIGSDIAVSSNVEITLGDGTKAYRSDIRWFYIPGQINLKTQMVASYKDGKMVSVLAHPMDNPERVAPIVESLRFD